jgi:hypothetical protein
MKRRKKARYQLKTAFLDSENTLKYVFDSGQSVP